jgi:hypothetical protein
MGQFYKNFKEYSKDFKCPATEFHALSQNLIIDETYIQSQL